jgi:hypothetical protein
MEYLFILYDATKPVRWFTDIEAAVEYGVANHLTIVRFHLFPDGSIKELVL